MTVPHIAPPVRRAVTQSRRTLRADERRNFDATVLRWFRSKHDTLTIAKLMDVHESLVVRALARAREAERRQF